MNPNAREPQTVDGVKVYPIPGYEGQYFVSKCGKVRSTFNGGRWLRPGLSGRGYLTVSLRGKTFAVHRIMAVVFLDAPQNLDTDHVNGDRTDNRLENLRLATRAQNMVNSRAARSNTSGFKGVSWCKSRKKWVARIGNGSVGNPHLGYFDCKAEAAKAYDEAAADRWGEFARLNLPSQCES